MMSTPKITDRSVVVIRTRLMQNYQGRGDSSGDKGVPSEVPNLPAVRVILIHNEV